MKLLEVRKFVVGDLCHMICSSAARVIGGAAGQL